MIHFANAKGPEPIGGPEPERFEEVSIETIHVGDYVRWSMTGMPHTDSHCVVAKSALRSGPSQAVVGWLLEVTNLGPLWLPRRAKFLRRRLA